MFTRKLQIIGSKQAFTLIEMLVVIFVLGVGILSITVLITRNLSLVKNIHTQTTATILAREGIEMVYNVRDTNNILGYERNCAQRATQEEISNLTEDEDICQKYMRIGDEQSYRFIIEGGIGTQSQIALFPITGDDFITLFNNSKLYLTGTSTPINITGYTHIGYGDTMFARYIEFTGMESLPSSTPITNNDIHHLTSKVLYKLSDTSIGEITLESFITQKE